jgi:dihydroorotate dehydrogenase electron transfer subunit
LPAAVEVAVVAASEPVADSLWLLHLEVPQIAAQARPGTFVLVRCADPDHPTFDPYLPRAYFIFACDPAAGRLSLLVHRRGRGSGWLCSRRAGDRALLHGPVGREIKPASLTRHLLLLTDSTDGMTGLAWLAGEASRRGLSVTLVENAAEAGGGVPAHLFSPVVEYRATTPEAGGLLGALPSLIRWADEIVLAAGPDMLELVASLRRSRLEPFTLHAGLPFQAIPCVWAGTRAGVALGGGDFLPCGAGWCGACGVATRQRHRLFCREGPAFALEDLRFLEEPGGEDDADVE